MSVYELLSVIVASLALIVAVLAWIESRRSIRRADRSNEIAESARGDAVEARTDQVWDSAIDALHQLVTFPYAAPDEPVRAYSVQARASLTSLVDRLNQPAVSEWLDAAWDTSRVLMVEAGSIHVDRNRPDYVEAVVDAGELAGQWFGALITNLRRVRADGLTDEQARVLVEDARRLARTVRERNGLPGSAETGGRYRLRPNGGDG